MHKAQNKLQERSKKMPDYQTVANIVRDAGGKIVGRTRLQKIAYLLELAGLGGGFSFEYRHYGPYSDDLASAVNLACLSGILEEKEIPTSWGGFYSVYNLLDQSERAKESDWSALIKEAVKADPIELELAATAAFLSTTGLADPWGETEKRKPEKAADERLQKAKALYAHLAEIQTPIALPKVE